MTASQAEDKGLIWTVIPAGGSGTRLWPLSRQHAPKFLHPLVGDRSLLQATVDRLAPIAPPDRTLIVCGAHHVESIRHQVPEIPVENIIAEPQPRGSAPAIGLAATLIARRDPNAIMASFAADHIIRKPGAFTVAVQTAIEAARKGHLVTIGLTPTFPATGFGYIERTDDVVADCESGTAYQASRFVEKPDLERATAFLETGRYLWNASMFIWQVSRLRKEMTRFLPDLQSGLDQIVDSWDGADRKDVLEQVWDGLSVVTIDNGIMELADRVAVVPADLDWSDVGDWHGLGEMLDSDEQGNQAVGRLLAIESRGSVTWAGSDRVIALLGVDDLIVVETEDAILVASRDRSQDVRRIVDDLKRTGRLHLT
jgi:mannose-1-phosphate guanylyltransferase